MKLQLANSEPVIGEQKQKVRGYVGIIGGVLTLLAMFMPYTRYWFDTITYYECAAMVTDSSLGPIVAIALVVFNLILCYQGYNRIAFFTAILFYPALLIDTSSSDILKNAQIGFYIMIIGRVLVILSLFCKKTNIKIADKIKSIQHTQNMKGGE